MPIRLFLQAYKDLTPTYVNINNKFSVQYFINLVLIDIEDRRFFKQIEINLVRLDKGKRVKDEKIPNIK
jgi:vacuolar protein sorting-associated protein 26